MLSTTSSSSRSLLLQDQQLLEVEQRRFLELDYDALRDRNFVTDMQRWRPDLLNFMVFTAAHAFDTSYYHPAFPIDGHDNVVRELLRTVRDVSRVNTVVPSVLAIARDQVQQALRTAKSDDDFIRAQAPHGDHLHRFLCFTLNFNNLFVTPQRLDRDYGRGDDDTAVLYWFKSMEQQVGDGCGGRGPERDRIAVFHGTSKCRLYSLIRNGAKTLQTVHSGRALGNGFYCATDFKTATTYSDGFVCAYVLSNASIYHKHDGIYVVDDPCDLCLSCVLSKRSDQGVVDYVAKTVRTSAAASASAVQQQRVRTGAGGTGRTHSKRLLADVKNVHGFFASEPGHAIRVEVDEGAFDRWRVHIGIDGFAAETPLVVDMKALGVREITLEAAFPGDYPFSPPFVRVLSPRFQRWTGHVTYGGSLCTEFLTLSDSEYAWKPVLSMSVALLMIKELLSLDGRLERTRQQALQAYDEKEAREAFQVALKRHGWQL